MEVRVRNSLGLSSDDKKERLRILWNEEVEVDIQSYNLNFIDCRMKEDEGSENWRFTLFYGDPIFANRCNTWDLLRSLS